MMQAVRLHEIGGPQNLRLDEVPVPRAESGEVLVRLRFAAFNRRDVFITQGLYPGIDLPRIIGSDGAGVVDGTNGEVVIDPMLGWGDDPHVWGAGASILGMPRDGTFAQYVAVPRENIHAKPSHLSWEEAAALPLAGLTAYRATFTRGELKAGETVLIPGVGGGVQSFALLFAKASGARAIVTSGSDEKLERAKSLGADVAINYREFPDWHKKVGRGEVDLVIDSSGGDTVAKSLSVVRPGGRIVIYGGTRREATFALFPLFWNHVDIRGTSMGSPQDFRAMLDFVSEHGVHPVVDRVFDMSDAASAAERLAQNDQFGKVVLRIE